MMLFVRFSTVALLSVITKSSGFVSQPSIKTRQAYVTSGNSLNYQNHNSFQQERRTPPKPLYQLSTEKTDQYEVGSFEDLGQIHKDADAIFSIIDVDGDGAISLSELNAHMTKSGYADNVVSKIFRKLDTNKDGVVSGAEFRDGMVTFAPLRSAPGLGNYNAEFVTEIHADADTLFRSIDEDGDGEITKIEMRSHLSRVTGYSDRAIDNIFGMLDADKDGTVSKEEVRDAFVRYSAFRQAVGEGPNFK
eukprot:CAMPEP_0194271384 /NCGR_PEP_ID=MMETSP0169-20130528/5172_1 /TAXON_ID=218684 /ORGANISM="Corethron pennatum, Strain L29A3" /LENGTH=247 /DNA_ID=CAMNT_0039013713 /DNA_START=14 /DNA_END=757 /DNA_ORIENTATION=-